MNLYKSIDKYLLQNYPAVWSTRVHVFAPIGSVVILIVFLFNAFLLGYNPKNDLPENGGSVLLMIIPSITFMVIWFVMQSKYNVTKSGGKLNVFQDYLNYFIYMLMFFIGFLLIIIIPISNDYKVYCSVGKTEFLKDHKSINLGHSVVKVNNSLSKLGNVYSYKKANLYGWHESEIAESEIVEDNDMVRVSKSELVRIITDYISAYNKYTKDEILLAPEELIKQNMGGNLNTVSKNDYTYFYQGDSVRSKIRRIAGLHNNGWLNDYFDEEGINVLAIFLAFFALGVWIFKQINWKQYVFGLVFLALTPVVAGIIGVVFFELFRFDDEVGLVLVLFAYFVVGAIVIVGLTKTEKSNLSVILSMYLQVFLPVLPFFIWGLCENNFRRDDFQTLLYFSWTIGLLGIAAFKYIYRRFELLPLKK
jgi:hypothetical protein